MRLKYKLCFFFVVFISFVSPIYADSFLSLSCPSSISSGGVISCDVIANSDKELSAVNTRVVVSNNLEFVSFITDANWQGNGESGNISLYTYPNRKGVVRLGSISVRVLDKNNSKTGTISLDNTTFFLSDFSDLGGKSVSVNFKILSLNSYLSGITLSNGDISPKFNKSVYDYEAIINSDTVMISATSEDENAVVSGTGLKELNYGMNNFVITVTSESGSISKYNINIFREDKKEDVPNIKPNDKDNIFNVKPSDKNDISSVKPSDKDDLSNISPNDSVKNNLILDNLVIDGYEINFKSDINTYLLELLYNEDKLDIKTFPISEDIRVTISGNNSFKIGENKVLIILEDESGNKNVYTITVLKKTSGCVLSKINIEGYSFDFKCDIFKYDLKIKDDKSLNIDVIPTLGDSKINIYNNDNLENNDIITISVLQGNSEYKYLINVIKDENSFSIFDNKIVIVLFVILMIFIGYFVYKKIRKKYT